MVANEHIKIGSNSCEKVKTFKYLGTLLTNQNSIQEEIKYRLKAGNSCYYTSNHKIFMYIRYTNCKTEQKINEGKKIIGI